MSLRMLTTWFSFMFYWISKRKGSTVGMSIRVRAVNCNFRPHHKFLFMMYVGNVSLQPCSMMSSSRSGLLKILKMRTWQKFSFFSLVKVKKNFPQLQRRLNTHFTGSLGHNGAHPLSEMTPNPPECPTNFEWRHAGKRKREIFSLFPPFWHPTAEEWRFSSTEMSLETSCDCQRTQEGKDRRHNSLLKVISHWKKDTWADQKTNVCNLH